MYVCLKEREIESVCLCVGEMDRVMVFLREREIHRVCVCVVNWVIDFRNGGRLLPKSSESGDDFEVLLSIFYVCSAWSF